MKNEREIANNGSENERKTFAFMYDVKSRLVSPLRHYSFTCFVYIKNMEKKISENEEEVKSSLNTPGE